jgi:hypothetical protein
MNLTRWSLFSQFVEIIQGKLFPVIEEELGPLTEKHGRVIRALSLLELNGHAEFQRSGPGRPAKYLAAMARSFVAKAVYNLSTTRQLIDLLKADKTLRRICGWSGPNSILDEAQFSRAFAAFSEAELPQRLHAALIEAAMKDKLVGHISRDSTEIDAREKPQRKAPDPVKAPLKRGRKKKGELPALPEPTRIEKQTKMTLEEMLDDLPKVCDIGTKRNSKGHQTSWQGFKFHWDVADGHIPISCVLTSASLHDSQAAIPLATMTFGRVTSLYDLMDSAYDAAGIHEHSRGLGHVPIIDEHPRRKQGRKEELLEEQKRCRIICFIDAEDRRYHERTTVERANARLKDEFGARMIRVRGHAKVMCHLMFGVLALTADQLLRLIT